MLSSCLMNSPASSKHPFADDQAIGTPLRHQQAILRIRLSEPGCSSDKTPFPRLVSFLPALVHLAGQALLIIPTRVAGTERARNFRWTTRLRAGQLCRLQPLWLSFLVLMLSWLFLGYLSRFPLHLSTFDRPSTKRVFFSSPSSPPSLSTPEFMQVRADPPYEARTFHGSGVKKRRRGGGGMVSQAPEHLRQGNLSGPGAKGSSQIGTGGCLSRHFEEMGPWEEEETL